jgi:hypothetical protein
LQFGRKYFEIVAELFQLLLTPCKRKTGHTSINGAECETKNSIERIVHEVIGNLLSQPYCLARDGEPANIHYICIDEVATGSASIAISDAPSFTGQLLSSI